MKFTVSFFILYFLLSPNYAMAATLNLTETSTSLDGEEEFSVNVSLSGAASNTTNYLRAAFFSNDSPTSYFGYTYNHLSNWYNGSPTPIDPHQFLEIQIGQDGSWNGQMQVKADINDSAFKGSGTYNLKIGRYTQGGSTVSDWSNSEAANITVSVPDPTPTPNPSPTPNQSPSPTPATTPTPKPTTSPTPTPIKSPSPSLKPTSTSSPSPSSETSTVLGESSDASASPSPSASPEAESGSLSKTKAAALITGAGAILIALSFGFYLWYSKLLGREKAQEFIEVDQTDKSIS